MSEERVQVVITQVHQTAAPLHSVTQSALPSTPASNL